jgi:hypothetical protein
MRQQSSPLLARWIEPAGREDKVAANRVGQRAEAHRRLPGKGIGMNPHRAEVRAEPRLKDAAGIRV